MDASINRYQIEPKKNVTIEVAGRRIFIRLPKNALDIQFLRSFTYVRWDPGAFVWVVPNYGQNLTMLLDYFNDRVASLNQSAQLELPTAVSGIQTIPVGCVLFYKTMSNKCVTVKTPSAHTPVCLKNSSTTMLSTSSMISMRP